VRSEKAKSLVAELSLPAFAGGTALSSYRWDSGPGHFRQISRCETIVRLLISNGANTAYDDRPFGPSLHLACLLGNKAIIELLFEKGAGINATAGYFEKAIFAAIQGSHSDIVALLREKATLTNHKHSELATPLHHACAIGDGASVRKLLECGANATVLNDRGRHL